MMAVFVLIQVDLAGGMEDMRAFHDTLHAISGVKTVHFVAGPTDVFVYAEASDLEGLMRTVGEIRSQDGVVTTDTRVVLPM
jgi:DNA-binding Lrp family transcriptional regulator